MIKFGLIRCRNKDARVQHKIAYKQVAPQFPGSLVSQLGQQLGPMHTLLVKI